MNEFLDTIASESESFAATIRADTLNRRVPGCPDWAFRELVWHLGRVQQFWALDVRAGADEPPEFDEGEPGPTEAGALAAWMRESTGALLDALPRRAAGRAGVDVVARAAHRSCDRPPPGARSGRAQVGRAVRARCARALARRDRGRRRRRVPRDSRARCARRRRSRSKRPTPGGRSRFPTARPRSRSPRPLQISCCCCTGGFHPPTYRWSASAGRSTSS